MNGPQDLQDFVGFDPIPGKMQPEEQVWPEWPVAPKPRQKNAPVPPMSPPTKDERRWEAEMNAIFALLAPVSRGPGGEPLLNLDMQRWYRETMHPRDYMNQSYYGLWLLSAVIFLDSLGPLSRVSGKDLCDHAIVSPQELERAREIIEKGKKEAAVGFGRPDAQGRFRSDRYRTDRGSRPLFRVGDRVRTVLQSSSGHTREYRYLRGREGIVQAVYPAEPAGQSTGGGRYERAYPDTASRGPGNEFYVNVYQVRFEGRDLFGEDFVEPGTAYFADMFETYLKPIAPRRRPVQSRS